MSNDKSRDALSDAPIPQRNNSAEVVRSGSPLDIVLWVIAIALLLGYHGESAFTSVLGPCK